MSAIGRLCSGVVVAVGECELKGFRFSMNDGG
jgi:hypothetical protein